jgi:hypothetical protein
LGATLKTALFIFCVTLVEVKVRDHRPDLGHRHRPNAHPELMGQDLRTDSHGFRSLSIPDNMKPDIIVVAYFINDAEPMPQYGDCRYRIDSLLRQFGEAPDWKHYYRALYEPDAEGWRQTQAAIAGFAQEARKIDAQLIVFNVPELRELKPYLFEDVTAKVRNAVEKQGVPFVDLSRSVQNLDPPSLWVAVPDPHPNGKADITFAKAMLPPITAMLDKLCCELGKS